MLLAMNPLVFHHCIQDRSSGLLYQLEYIPSGACWLSWELFAESASGPRPKISFGVVGAAGGVAVGGGGGIGVDVGRGAGGDVGQLTAVDVGQDAAVGVGQAAAVFVEIGTPVDVGVAMMTAGVAVRFQLCGFE